MKAKRCCSVVFLLFASMFLSFADPVPVQKAASVADNFMAQNGMSLKLSRVSFPETKAGDPAFYVFSQEGKGFVIVAADDAAGPVLAYSLSNGFTTEGMPDHVRDWLEQIAEDVRMRASSGQTQTARAASSWAALASPVRTKADDEKEVVINTAKWGQRDPYNRMCPVENGKATLTGCTATAIAIVMRHHKWPKAGTGVLPDYEYYYGHQKQSGHGLGHSYAWGNMLMSYRKGFSNTDAEAVATLMYDVGIMCRMSYGVESSAAYPLEGVLGLYTYMDYDASARALERSMYEDEEWKQMIIKEIDENRLVLYSADSKESGHTFVVDGYRGEDYFHINFGWSGTDDGFYILPEFGKYDRGHEMFVGIKKNEGGVHSSTLTYSIFNSVGLDLNKPFMVSVSSVRAMVYDSFYGEVGIAKASIDGELTILAEKVFSADSRRKITQRVDFTCSLDGDVKLGDYLIPVYREAGVEDWKPMYFDIEANYVDYRYIPLSKAQDILDVCSTSFDRTSGALFVSMPENFSLSIDDLPSGTSVVKKTSGGYVVETSELTPGKHTVRIMAGVTPARFTITI